MTELIYFFGRLHVLLLHLPIGILLLAVVLEIISRQQRFRYLQPAVGFVWAVGALSAIGTVALGYMHASEGGFEGAALGAHRLAGTSLAVLACVIWLARAEASGFYGKAWPAGSAGVVLLLLLTGHFGGTLTHGDTYLAEYAPRSLRRLLGSEEAATAARPKPAGLESADLYLDVVAPSLQQRCATCHNQNKRKGGFSVVSHPDLMKGGKAGVVIVAGQPEASDLIRRIGLDPSHEDFMPRDGKTPLTAEQGAAIAWWVSVGAPRRGEIAALQPTPAARAAVASVLGFGGAAVHQASSEGGPAPMASSVVAAPPDLAPADAEAVHALESNGFVVRPIATGNPLVQVDYTAHRNIGAADMAALARIGAQIHALNLRDAGLADQHLATIGKFENLAHLRLEMNPITDAGVAQLQGLGKLEYLNLYGTRLSDKSIAQLARLEKLRDLFVWRTAITAAGIAQLQRTRAGLNVNGGFDPRTFPAGPKVIPVVN